MTASLSIAVAYASMALAHNQGGTLDIKKTNPKATDIYLVTCDDDSDHLLTSLVNVSAGGGLVSVHVYYGTKKTSDTKITTAADPNITVGDSSPLVKTYGGNGVYTLLVDKTGDDAEAYQLLFHCQNSSNLHTETSIGMRQDE